MSVPDEGYSSLPGEGYSSLPDEGYSRNRVVFTKFDIYVFIVIFILNNLTILDSCHHCIIISTSIYSIPTTKLTQWRFHHYRYKGHIFIATI